MNNIQKISDITTTDLAEYIRLDEVTSDDTALLNTLLSVAKTFISSYTGRSSEELDDFQDFVIVVISSEKQTSFISSFPVCTVLFSFLVLLY